MFEETCHIVPYSSVSCTACTARAGSPLGSTFTFRGFAREYVECTRHALPFLLQLFIDMLHRTVCADCRNRDISEMLYVVDVPGGIDCGWLQVHRRTRVGARRRGAFHVHMSKHA